MTLAPLRHLIASREKATGDLSYLMKFFAAATLFTDHDAPALLAYVERLEAENAALVKRVGEHEAFIKRIADTPADDVRPWQDAARQYISRMGDGVNA